MKPPLTTLAVVLAVIAAWFMVSCRLLPVQTLPPNRVIPALTGELNRYLPPPDLTTNVLALPTPPGSPVALMTNVARVRPAAMALAILPPPKPVVRSFGADYPPYHGPLTLLAVCATATNVDGPWTVIGSTQYPSNGGTLTLNLTNGAARRFARFGWSIP